MTLNAILSVVYELIHYGMCQLNFASATSTALQGLFNKIVTRGMAASRIKWIAVESAEYGP